jgi:hypothetical protein
MADLDPLGNVVLPPTRMNLDPSIALIGILLSILREAVFGENFLCRWFYLGRNIFEWRTSCLRGCKWLYVLVPYRENGLLRSTGDK